MGQIFVTFSEYLNFKVEQVNSQTTEAEKLETKPQLIRELPKTGKFYYSKKDLGR